MKNEITTRSSLPSLLIACLICTLICIGVGVLASILTPNMKLAYSELKMPPFAPPGILFPIVWSVLYIMMGVSLGIIIHSESTFTKLLAIMLFICQLILNFLWSIIFFNLRLYILSSVWIVVLWIVILATIVVSTRISRVSGVLLIPYLCWVTFATYLTIGVAILN